MTDPSGTYQPYEPDDRRPVLAQTPITVSGQGQWTGTATGVQTRVEGGGPNARGETVLSFRLRAADRDQPVEVELRAHRLTGTVAEGDQVVVPGTIGRSGRLEPQRLQNLTTHTVVGAASTVHRGLRVAFVVIFVVLGFLAILIGAVVMLFGAGVSG